MIQQDEFKTLKNFWIIFQIIIPLLLIIIEVSIRYSDNFTIIDFLKTQKLSLIGFVIFMGLFSKVLAERKFVNAKNLNLKFKALNFMAFCIMFACISLTSYVLLIKIGITLKESSIPIYSITSCLTYLIFIILAYTLYMNFLKALILKKNNK